MKILVSVQADQDLLEIFSYLAPLSPSAAQAAAEAIDEKMRNLANFPFIGPARPSLAAGMRSAVVGTHVIFYTVNNDHITVVRILDGRRDIDAEFRR